MLANPVPLTDVHSFTRTIMHKIWQSKWNEQINNKLHAIKPKIEIWESCHSRKESVILTRLRIGHTRLTHQHLFKGEDQPKCRNCQVNLSVQHLLIDCPVLNNLRLGLFKNNFNLSTLIGSPPNPNLFNFLRLSGFYDLL